MEKDHAPLSLLSLAWPKRSNSRGYLADNALNTRDEKLGRLEDHIRPHHLSAALHSEVYILN